MQASIIYIVIFLLLVGTTVWFFTRGETVSLGVSEETAVDAPEDAVAVGEEDTTSTTSSDEESGAVDASQSAVSSRTSEREVLITDGTKHSIPLDEILSGGPPKDGIPSIDNPKFVDADEADFLDSESVGLGVVWKGEARFYPYQILVWHEIVNDAIQGDPVLVTYCPLCATGIVFERRVNGIEQEFGVSGLLWQSNLLMYNRTGNPDTESLWSQVLGEAVLGPATGEKLAILRSDTVRFGDWSRAYSDTLVLSTDTGALRNYGVDPYGNYYTDSSVSFGATFNDTRLHPKIFVIGIEVNGLFKAYPKDSLPVGTTEDTFAGTSIILEKSDIGEVDVFAGADKKPIETVDGFWFSWLAVHPDTELYGE